jgi:2-keto-3-deoxy-L-rhamnonate aldolase RhmA
VTSPLSGPAGSFRARLVARETLIGTFVKTPTSIVCEVLSRSPLDCLCLDAEHAPFDRRDIDACAAVLAAAGPACLVRVPSSEPSAILQALDSGALGVVIPHVDSAARAASVARLCRFSTMGRGYAGSTRSAGFGTVPMKDHITLANERVAVIAQIEDRAALDEIDAIARSEGIDALFIGRMDLSVSLGATGPLDPRVQAATEQIISAAVSASRAVGMFVGAAAEVRGWRERGVTFFLVGSDQTFLLEGATSTARALS